MEHHYRIIIAAFQLVRAHGGELFSITVTAKYRKSKTIFKYLIKEKSSRVEQKTTMLVGSRK